MYYVPPFIDPSMGTVGKARVEDINAAKGGGSVETVAKRGIVVQSETATEPMDQMLVSLLLWQRHDGNDRQTEQSLCGGGRWREKSRRVVSSESDDWPSRQTQTGRDGFADEARGIGLKN